MRNIRIQLLFLVFGAVAGRLPAALAQDSCGETGGQHRVDGRPYSG